MVTPLNRSASRHKSEPAPPRFSEILAVIDAPHFYAGIVLRNDRVIEAANVVRYMKGWARDKVREYCKRKGWSVSVVSETWASQA